MEPAVARNPIRVVAAVMARDGRILIARRRRGDHQESKWEFPGGKIEPGETPEESLRRELREEFAIEAEVEALLGMRAHDYGDRVIELAAYWVRVGAGDFALRAHDEIAWARPEEMSRFDFAPADLFIVERLRNQGVRRA